MKGKDRWRFVAFIDREKNTLSSPFLNFTNAPAFSGRIVLPVRDSSDSQKWIVSENSDSIRKKKHGILISKFGKYKPILPPTVRIPEFQIP